MVQSEKKLDAEAVGGGYLLCVSRFLFLQVLIYLQRIVCGRIDHHHPLSNPGNSFLYPSSRRLFNKTRYTCITSYPDMVQPFANRDFAGNKVAGRKLTKTASIYSSRYCWTLCSIWNTSCSCSYQVVTINYESCSDNSLLSTCTVFIYLSLKVSAYSA